MEHLIANTDDITFDIEVALDRQQGSLLLPFKGMDKSNSGVCRFYYTRKGCSKGDLCPYRHDKGNQTTMCKHWLRGLCHKSDRCSYLHEYNLSKMPECYTAKKFGSCDNPECLFLHSDRPENNKIENCPWYDRGFCIKGPLCKYRHVRRVLCKNYVAGFCQRGPKCKYTHPRFELPVPPVENVQERCEETGRHRSKESLKADKSVPPEKNVEKSKKKPKRDCSERSSKANKPVPRDENVQEKYKKGSQRLTKNIVKYPGDLKF